VLIDFFSPDDLKNLYGVLAGHVAAQSVLAEIVPPAPDAMQEAPLPQEVLAEPVPEPQDDDLYSVKNFSL